MKYLTLLFLLVGCQDYNSNSADRDRYGRDTVGPIGIIQNRCVNCHQNAHNEWASLQTDEAWATSRWVVPGNPDASSLINRIKNYGPGGDMPNDSTGIPDAEFEELKEWVTNLPP